LLYEMVTGLVPFTGASPLDVAFQHVNSNVSAPSSIQPDVPPAVDHLVLAATRKSPAERIQSAREFRDGVIRALSAVPRAEALTTALPLQNTQVIPTPVQNSPRATSSAPPEKQNAASGSGETHNEVLEKRRIRKWTPLLLALSLLIGGGAWYQFTGSYEAVPPVSSLTVDEATAILTPLELGVDVVEEFSEDIPAGVIIRTEPAGGENARKGSPITLFVSKGQERYIIPSDLAGKDPNDATSVLEALTLVISGTNEVFDELLPVGKVVGTQPVGGTSVKRETPVVILVSKGPAPVEVPPIVGTLITDATTTLGELGLTSETIREDFDDSPAGTILTTEPIPGTTVPKGTVIKVVLSKGPVLVDVPNVVGLDVEAATTKLQSAGFQVTTTNRLPVAVLNKVYSQNPAAGSKAPKGSVITLEIV
jgi:serine/threonine-protein kinase